MSLGNTVSLTPEDKMHRTTVIIIGPMNLPIPSEKGAVEEIIWQVSKRIKKKGFNVLIFNPVVQSSLKKIIITLKNMSANSPDDTVIIHSHSYYSVLPYILRRVPLDLKMYLTLHAPPWVTKNAIRFNVLMRMLNLLSKNNVKIVSPSLSIKKFLEKNDIKTIYIPNGVDPEQFNPNRRKDEIREKLLDGKDYLILNVGRVCPEKNQLDLLRAVRLMIKERRDFRVVFIGPIGQFHKSSHLEYYLQLNEYVNRHGLKRYALFMGEVPKKEVATIMASADLLVHTSLVEAAAPLVILEAMASGLPIIAYNLLYYKGYLFNDVNALLVPSRDILSLKNAIEELLCDRERRLSIAKTARRLSLTHFSWDVIVDQYYIKAYIE